MNVLLIGAGHAHLQVASRTLELKQAGIELTLIDPGLFWYSGMATGLISGLYRPEEDQLDPRILIEPQGGTFLQDRVTGISTKEKKVTLQEGDSVPYDVISLNVGSVIRSSIPGADEYALPAKPIPNLLTLHQRISDQPEGSLVVIGAGATGVEVASMARDLAPELEITLVSSGSSILEGFPERAVRKIKDRLNSRNIQILCNRTVDHMEEGKVRLQSGDILSFDTCVNATGLVPPDWIGHLGLATGPGDGLWVTPTLQSVEDPNVFAVGDCADLQGHPLPRLGVYGVRQGPVLVKNLIANATGKYLEPYTPQKRALQILHTGDRHALATYGKLGWHGKTAFLLKDWIDRRFLKTFTRG